LVKVEKKIMDESQPVTVLADAQFGTVRTLRPFDGFEAVYQGANARKPLMWTEQGRAIDEAGQEGLAGYASNLIRGIEVPLGSRIILWIPSAVYILIAEVLPYTWDFTWRIRNLHDYNLKRNPWHLPKQGAGTADTTPGTGGPRVLIPASTQSIVYTQAEPADPNARVVQAIHPESYTGADSSSGLEQLPLIPNGTNGYYEQGVLDPNISATAGVPTYFLHEMQAMGDELLIGMRRQQDQDPDEWDFSDPVSADGPFAGLLDSSPDIGIFIMTGSSP
jgi:hypothetical protein